MFPRRIMDDFTCPGSILSEFCFPFPQFSTLSVLGIPILLLLLSLSSLLLLLFLFLLLLLLLLWKFGYGATQNSGIPKIEITGVTQGLMVGTFFYKGRLGRVKSWVRRPSFECHKPSLREVNVTTGSRSEVSTRERKQINQQQNVNLPTSTFNSFRDWERWIKHIQPFVSGYWHTTSIINQILLSPG